MAEGGATAPADLGIDLGAELDRIEAAVAAGDTDLRSLGFWRIVARVKPDRVLADRFADQIGRIDTAAFRMGVRFRVPVWAGNMLLIGATLGGLAAVILAHIVSSTTLSGLLLLAAGGVWTVSLHSPTHWFVGHLAGIRFTHYFLGQPLPYPGLKSDYSTYLRADAGSRAWMHASGAIATKLAPLLALAFWPGTEAPWWSAAGLVAICLVSIATDIAFSVKVGDWKKFRRERAVAKARASV
jgi:hypothetical protein